MAYDTTKEKTVQNKHVRKGDKVVITSGNDRGLTGTVLSRTTDRAIVQGVNVRKKHVKKTQTHPQGGVISIERPVHVAKLKLLNNDGKAVRPKVRVDAEGNRELYYREGKKDVSLRQVKKSKV